MDEKVKVLLFGILHEKIGTNELFCAQAPDSDSLLHQLRAHYEIFNEVAFTVAINKKIISENTIINIQDEVALLPPFSGG